MQIPSLSLGTVASLVILAGCAASSPAPMATPDVPQALRAPAGQTYYLEALATGYQIYECSQKADSTYEWAFKAPEAALVDRAGKSLGKHYGGPTWEGSDGSTVVGEVKARDPGPQPSAIPWLLLSAKSNTGYGTFSSAKSIQRVATTGGLAPTQPCTAANLKQAAKVPYTATYYFYR
jgi:hypothetical protein